LIAATKDWIKARWPALRLRTILFATLFLVAGLPGISAVFLRVYENALVRQTEAELMAQGAVAVALIEQSWPGGPRRPAFAPPPVAQAPDRYSSSDLQQGYRVAADQGQGQGQDQGMELYYQLERPTIDLRFSNILPDRPPAQPTLMRANPDAVIAAEMAAPVLAQAARSTLASIRVTDAQAIVTYGREDKGQSYAHLDEVKSALSGKRITVLRTNTTYEKRTILEIFSRGSTLRVHHARPIKIAGQVVGAVILSRSPRGLFVGMYEDRGKIAAGALGIFLLLLFIVGLLVRGIARPIDELAEATKGGARGTLDVPETPATAAIEIRTLYANFREMAARIDKRSRYLQDFAAAVSHEFKTPLAGIKGALELLDDHGETMKPEERQRFLSNANADADRMQHLVERLLDLARADMASRIDDVAERLLPPVSRIADAHRTAAFTIEVEIDEGINVAVPAATLEAVIETLIENAQQAGATQITLSAQIQAGRCLLTIADNGPGIAPGDRDRVFDTFFTTRRSSGGSGLGLAIARSLLAASGAKLALKDNDDRQGACFILTLPLGGA
jgi:signal transduction histidine kinase